MPVVTVLEVDRAVARAVSELIRATDGMRTATRAGVNTRSHRHRLVHAELAYDAAVRLRDQLYAERWGRAA